MTSDQNKPFLEHLEDLRQVILKSLSAVVLMLVPAYPAAGRVLPWLLRQLEYIGGKNMQFHYFSPFEPFFVQLKCALLLAIFGALPYVSWQVVGFIAPGLYRHERRIFGTLAIAAFLLFVCGAAFAFTMILPLLLRFAASYHTDELVPLLGLNNFVDLAGLLLMGFGLMFQLPIVVIVLVRTGLIRASTLARSRPIVVIVILVLSAILTPPDVISQLLLALPTWVLFEIALLVAARLQPGDKGEPRDRSLGSAGKPGETPTERHESHGAPSS